jgi:hypothetical protein
VERTQVFFEFDLNEYSELATLFSDRKDFCGDGSHMCHFIGQTSPKMESALKNFRRGEAPWQQRDSRILAPVADEVELIRKATPS